MRIGILQVSRVEPVNRIPCAEGTHDWIYILEENKDVYARSPPNTTTLPHVRCVCKKCGSKILSSGLMILCDGRRFRPV